MNKLNLINHRTFKDKCYFYAGIMLTVMAFGARISVSLKSITLIIAVILMIAAGDWRSSFKQIINNKVAVAAILLYCGLLFGAIYSSAPFHERLHILRLYLILLYIPLLIPLFKHDYWKKTIISAFIYGCVLTGILGIINNAGLINLTKIFHLPTIGTPPEYPFGTFSFGISFAAYLAAQMAWQTKKIRYVGCLLFLTWFILFVSNERTGYVLYITLAIIFFVQHLKLKQLIVACLLLLAVLLIAFNTSTTFYNRILLIKQNIKDYRLGNPVSPVGLRILFVKNSYNLWRERPFLGYGTGGFVTAYLTQNSYNALGEKATVLAPLDQPHNEYAYMAVQLGIVGVIFFINFLLSQIIAAKKLPKFYQQCAHAFTISFILASLDGTLLFYAIDGGSIMLFSALIFADENTNSVREESHCPQKLFVD